MLIRVFGEPWEIEFVQSNDEHGCEALQTPFPSISADALFMGVDLV